MRPRQLVLLLALVPCWSFSPSARAPRRARVDRAASAEPAEVVALTREHGKNDELRALLEARLSLRTLELPCIAHESAADTARLPDVLRAGGADWDWVLCTSPEAAAVLVGAWEAAARPALALAAVGKATCAALRRAGLDVAFTPSKATGKTLAAELPLAPPGAAGASAAAAAPRVLYPASARAADTVANGLTARGFEVTRLDAYTTVPATWPAGADADAARARVVTFASPSAVQVWAERVGTGSAAACIGETSAAACREAGWASERVFWPEKPGMDGWLVAVENAARG